MGDETTQSEKKGRKIRRLLKIFSLITSSVLFVFLLVIIFLNLYGVIPKISSEVIVIILVLTIITFSGSFTSFSIGNIFSMSRELKSAKDEIARLSNYNIALQKTVVSANVNANQKQTNNFYYAAPASPSDAKDKITEDESEMERSKSEIKISRANLVKRGIDEYIRETNVDESSIIRNIAIQYSSVQDSITHCPCVYDAYLRNANNEIFLEIKGEISYSYNLFNRLYFMLNRIYMLNISTNLNAHLVLIFMKTSQDKQNVIEDTINKIKDNFSEAYYKTKILEIREYDYTE